MWVDVPFQKMSSRKSQQPVDFMVICGHHDIILVDFLVMLSDHIGISLHRGTPDQTSVAPLIAPAGRCRRSLAGKQHLPDFFGR